MINMAKFSLTFDLDSETQCTSNISAVQSLEKTKDLYCVFIMDQIFHEISFTILQWDGSIGRPLLKLSYLRGAFFLERKRFILAATLEGHS